MASKRQKRREGAGRERKVANKGKRIDREKDKWPKGGASEVHSIWLVTSDSSDLNKLRVRETKINEP